MLRIFFGLFDQKAVTDWWTAFGYDNLHRQFLWGKSTTLATKVITAIKRHRVVYNVGTTVYDEYIDLEHAAIEPQAAEFFAQFTNQAGITTPYPISPTTLASAVHNTLEVDGEIGEWLQTPTRILSETYPPTTSPYLVEEFAVVNETMENDPSLAATGYVSFTLGVKSSTTYGYVSEPVVVPYNAVTDTIRIMYRVPQGTVTRVVVYRAPVVLSEFPQKFLNWREWGGWRLVHNHLPVSELNLGGSAGSYISTTSNFANPAVYAYPTPTLTNFAVFAPYNNSLARMNLVWQRRTLAGYQPLIINTDAMTYYKGYLVKLAPSFETGVGLSGGKSAQFSLAITEEGYCSFDALTAPNTSGNFTPVTRAL